jgi:hypothetical protein
LWRPEEDGVAFGAKMCWRVGKVPIKPNVCFLLSYGVKQFKEQENQVSGLFVQSLYCQNIE